MPRRGDGRSPSPAGSRRGGGRDDDRYGRHGKEERRDDGRSYRRRSRSREVNVGPRSRSRSIDATASSDHSPNQRRYDDRDRRRGHEDPREYDRDYHRSGRDYRDRSRDRHHYRRDDSRDRPRRREDDTADSRRKGRRDGSRESVRSRDHGRGRDSPKAKDQGRAPATNGKSSEASAPNKQSEEEQKKVRLARLEAWKAKQMAEQERKQKELQSKATGPALLQEMDEKASATAVTSNATSAESTPLASPAPYAGKFDPKVFTRKGGSAQAPTKMLGGDILVPPTVKLGAAVDPSNRNKASFESKLSNGEQSPREPLRFSMLMIKVPSAKRTAASGNVKSFGFGGMQTADKQKIAPRGEIGFEDELEDEDTTKQKLKKLPTLIADDGASATPDAAEDQGVEDDDDDDGGDIITGTEEEIAAAARAAAERRGARLGEEKAQAEEASAESMDTTADPTQTQPAGESMAAEEEIDPLDAFMAGLSAPAPIDASKGTNSTIPRKRKLQKSEELLADEGDVFDAIEDGNPNDILAMAAKRSKKKDLPKANHKATQYEDVNFSFYKPPEELSAMSEEEVKDLRLELDGIRVKGDDCPAPVQNWAQCGLGMQTLDIIHHLGYAKPSSIQAQAIPAIMSGRDVIGVAKTGSGKTIAYLLPMFRHIRDQRSLENMEGPIALIIAPTRELATQIHRDCKPFLRALNLRAACTYGGAPIKDQIADLKRGVEIIVCTPGRLIELLTANSGRVTNMKRVTYAVLDEADRMFDMGFEPQIQKILDQIRPKRQTVLFSATFPSKMESLARKCLRKPLEIQVGGRSVVASEITQIVEVRSEDSKFVRLLQILGEFYQDDEAFGTLVFVDRQESADGLLNELMRKGYPSNSIHGGKDQIDRDSTITDFKNGVFPVLIATSVAARGLDVKNLKLVINYDCPNHLEDYVHRVGRTGRAGNTGTAITFITEEQDRYAFNIAKALKQSGTAIPEDLQKLADSFNEKVKSGQAKWGGGGFGGRGIEKYDELYESARARERKAYKTGDEPEEEVDIEKKAGFTEDIVVKSRDDAAPVPAEKPSIPGLPKGLDLDESKIIVHKTEIVDAGAAGNALDKVRQAAERISGRLGQRGKIHPGQPIDNRGPDAGAFHTTLEINDFPQKARWAVTNRTNVAKILEATGTSITTKGTYYAAGKEPGPNDHPKLYILVEGDTEIVVRNAMSELMRLLREGTIAAADSEAKAPVSGRYKVV